MPQIVSTERNAKISAKSGGGQVKGGNSTNTLIGILLAVLVVVGLVRMLTAKPAAPDIPRARVVAAARDIQPGMRVGFADVRYIDIPQEYANQAMFDKTNQVVGRISTIFIPERNPIENGYLHPVNKTLSHSLENHERALTIKLNEEGLVDHQLFPGDRVDVLVTSTKNSRKYTKTICKNVKVLMAATRDMLNSNGAARNSRNQNRVTLAVLPDQAELITHAEQVGTPRLILRNRLATNTPKVYGASEEDLLPESAHLAVATPGVQNGTSLIAPPPVMEPILSLPDLPPVPPQLQQLPAAVKNSVGWVVEVFTGSKKEIHEFPNQSTTAN